MFRVDANNSVYFQFPVQGLVALVGRLLLRSRYGQWQLIGSCAKMNQNAIHRANIFYVRAINFKTKYKLTANAQFAMFAQPQRPV